MGCSPNKAITGDTRPEKIDRRLGSVSLVLPFCNMVNGGLRSSFAPIRRRNGAAGARVIFSSRVAGR